MGRYDKIVTDISRFSIKKIKEGKRYFNTNVSIPNVPFEAEFEFHIFYDDNSITHGDVAVSGASFADEDTAIIYVHILKNHGKNWINELIPEMKGVLRHEIEHITQDYIDSKPKSNFSSLRNIIYFGKNYFIDPYEAEAQVHGLYKQAKSQKRPLNEVIDDYLNWFEMTLQSKEKIKKVWKTIIANKLNSQKIKDQL